MLRMFLQSVGILGAAVLALIAVSILSDIQHAQEIAYVRPITSSLPLATSTEEAAPAEETEVVEPVQEIAAQPVNEGQPAAAAQSQEADTGNQVQRIQDPYPFNRKSESELYASAWSATVNIFCEAKGPLSSISGSGVLIDPRGVILTNAHVAQYMLLASQPDIALQCFIRTGSPAQKRYKADILHMPAEWVAEHAEDIVAKRPKGTGENDYALLLITETIDGSPLPRSFPHLLPDTREAIAFTSDKVLLAGYPAEFAIKDAGGTTLYPTSMFTRIGDLLTFGERSVDLVSLGGAVLAQSGSSGGAVINEWGRLVGIISTTSEGATTAERELRAITLAYIDRDIQSSTGSSLSNFLSGDLTSIVAQFMTNNAPALAQQIIDQLPKAQ